jgi:hypothetical protein
MDMFMIMANDMHMRAAIMGMCNDMGVHMVVTNQKRIGNNKNRTGNHNSQS